MGNKLTAWKAALAAGLSALGAFLGWKGILALVWVAAMATDYLSGSAAACKRGEWSSALAREGLWHKGGMILVVLAGALADVAVAAACQNLAVFPDWPELVLPLVLVWYILTELGSILENAVKLGAAVPGWLVKLMKVSQAAVDAQIKA